jgi:hypothetical protein
MVTAADIEPRATAAPRYLLEEGAYPDRGLFKVPES